MSFPRVLALALLFGCSASAPDRTPTGIALAPSSPASLVSGTTLSVVAAVTNSRGQALDVQQLTWTSSDPGVASVAGGATGVVTGIRIGTANITARVGDVVSPSLAVTVTHGPPVRLSLVQEPGDALSGEPLTPQPIVEIRDAAGNVVTSSNVSVTASIESGGGTLEGEVIRPGVNGVATFTNLVIRGQPGSRRLAFTATAMLPTMSVFFGVGVDPEPTAVALSPSTPQQLTSGQSLPLTAAVVNRDGIPLALGPVTWASGDEQILVVSGSGVVTAQRLGTARIVAKYAGLASDSLAVTSRPIVSYGATDAKVIRLDPGGEATPAFSAMDVFGTPAPGVSAIFESRAGSVASVAADGRITALAGGGGGAGFVAAGTSVGFADSVYVQVPPATGPVLRTDVTRIAHGIGDEILVRVVLDTRGATVGAATLSLTWPHDPFIGFLELLDVDVTTGGLGTVFETPVNGQVRASFVSSAGATGVLEVMRVRLRVRTFPNPLGRTGWLILLPQDVVGIDFSPLTSSVTPLRYPLTVVP